MTSLATNNILGLDIPVQNPVGMNNAQCSGDLTNVVHCLGFGEGFPGLDELRQGLPWNIIHHHEGQATLLKKVENPHNIRMLTASEVLGFFDKPLAEAGKISRRSQLFFGGF